jgi:anti-anti-sigma regulatory factor
MGHSPTVIDLSQISFADVAGYRAMSRFGDRCTRSGLRNIWTSQSPSVALLWRLLGEPASTVEPLLLTSDANTLALI